MARRGSELSDDQVLDLAFEHAGQMARLLRAAGHAELAALLDGLTDVGELWRRRMAAGRQESGNVEVLTYVLAQLDDLAALMDLHGRADAALLLRFPNQYAAARREEPKPSDPFMRSAEANDSF